MFCFVIQVVTEYVKQILIFENFIAYCQSLNNCKIKVYSLLLFTSLSECSQANFWADEFIKKDKIKY